MKLHTTLPKPARSCAAYAKSTAEFMLPTAHILNLTETTRR